MPKIFIPIIAVVTISVFMFGYIIYQNQKSANVPPIVNNNYQVDDAKTAKQKSIARAEKALLELRSKTSSGSDVIRASSTAESILRAEKALEELRKKSTQAAAN